MKPSDRRDQFLNLLHSKATTVTDVARTLGVTERTIYRDIAALRASGHGIEATPGPGGGVRIAPNSRPRPVHFEVAEIVGLALSVAILQATPHMPFAKSAKAALDRACMALSSERRHALDRLRERILVGSPATERVRRSLGAVDDALLPVVERCLTGNRSMGFDYVDSRTRTTTRQVECIALVLHSPTWYVLAWDLDKDASRLFRMDRISAPRCRRLLTELHPISEVIQEVDPKLDVWNRRPIG